MTQNITVRQIGDVLEITMDRAEDANKITNEMGARLTELFEGVDAQTKLVVLKGAGQDFCAGRQSPPIDRATASAQDFKDQIAAPPLALYAAIKACTAPVMGAVQGRAAGVGAALAALCDFTLARKDASFDLPELGHGIPPTLVMTALADRLPYQVLAYMVLTGEAISAVRAAQLGLVAQVLPLADFDQEVDRIVAHLNSRPADALWGIKEFLRHGVDTSSPGRAALAANLIATIQSSRGRRADQ